MLLNELLRIDRRAITELFDIKVRCNKALAGHNTVEVTKSRGEDTWYISVRGIINGLFEHMILVERRNIRGEIEKFVAWECGKAM